MAQTSRFDLVDQLLGGKLAKTLTGFRDQQVTFDEMAQHFARLGIPVSRETLRRWLKQIDAERRVA